MKTKKLKYIPEYNFDLLGLSTSENDYKLSWLISKEFGIEFCKCKELKVFDRKNSEELCFSVFENCDKTNIWNLKLIANKGNLGYLLPELRNVDYFLMIFDKDETILLKEIIQKLKSINEISGVFIPDIQKLKSKERLIF
jgi:hypothetical protein